MNVNRFNIGDTASSCTVQSVYFACSTVMDESLSDFQEKKSGSKGPKTVQKAASKVRTNKPPKKLKGQKDIRTTLLKGKKIELLAYSEEFDKICKKSGIDIDAEQLQIAVALSKSLQETDTENYDPTNYTHYTQGRTKLIRSTLQEYGFKVPVIKITQSKKAQKQKKAYKLLTSSVEEKKQYILDKYAQVLFSNNACENLNENNCYNLSYNKLYYLTTNVSYKEIQNNDVLYVDNLLEKSTSKGTLLRNWSDIPGRPVSPKHCDYSTMNVSEIECSQEELDKILSGSMKTTKNIMKNIVQTTYKGSPVVGDESNIIEIPDDHKEESFSKKSITNRALLNREIRYESDDSKQSRSVTSRVRSCSPDIFDDDISIVLDKSNENNDKALPEAQISGTMDLTQCTEKFIENSSKKSFACGILNENATIIADCSKNVDFSETLLKNITQRKSNDFMEITECVAAKSDNRKCMYIESINILNESDKIISYKNSRMSNDCMEMTDCISNKVSQNVEANIDLTQNSDESNKLGSGISEDNVLIELDNELPLVQIRVSNDISLNNTVLLDDNEIGQLLNKTPKYHNNLQNSINFSTADQNIKIQDLNNSDVENNDNEISKSIKSSQSFFDYYIHSHSDDFDIVNQNDASPNKVDLTQSSDETVQNTSKTYQEPESSSLGKRDNVSVDYDDVQLASNIYYEKSDEIDLTQSNVSNPSQVSTESSSRTLENFNVIDEEFNYSINKSRNHIIFDNFGGTSVLDDIPNVEKCKESATECTESNFNVSNSFLPEIDIRRNVVYENEATESVITTPHTDSTKLKTNMFNTPSTSEYIIKTDEVTPMLDYGSMSTPDRNKELEKYGLKPFKRKRAVQLLTHLYNQTHPFAEPYSEGISPSKKPRQDQSSPQICLPLQKSSQEYTTFVNCPKTQPSNVLKETSSSSSSSPLQQSKFPIKEKRKDYTSPRKITGSQISKTTGLSGHCGKELNLFEMTKEFPDLKTIDCSEADWVFPTRQKSKIHSCRVPLHIVFHNYVSCRQRLREAILRYEPVNIDVIHKELVATGYRFDPKELLKFMDKKCITVKTEEKNNRNTKRHY